VFFLQFSPSLDKKKGLYPQKENHRKSGCLSSLRSYFFAAKPESVILYHFSLLLINPEPAFGDVRQYPQPLSIGSS
jgi:hypothetical protein